MGRALSIPAGHQGPSPGGSPAPRWCPSVPSHPWCSLFLPPALGFFLRKRGRRRPIQTSGVRQGQEQGMLLLPGLFLALAATLPQKGAPKGSTQPHRGWHLLNISPGSPHSPWATLHHPQSCFSQHPPNPNRASSATPCLTPMSHPMALPPLAGAQRRGPHGNTA